MFSHVETYILDCDLCEKVELSTDLGAAIAAGWLCFADTSKCYCKTCKERWPKECDGKYE